MTAMDVNLETALKTVGTVLESADAQVCVGSARNGARALSGSEYNSSLGGRCAPERSADWHAEEADGKRNWFQKEISAGS